MLSFKEWELLFAGSESEDQVEDPSNNITETVNQEASTALEKLCRICSSNGLISIHSIISQWQLKLKTRKNSPSWDVPIAQIISEISGEAVTSDDLLPQFICEHCLGYLAHAYDMRLQIIANSKNLRLAVALSDKNSIQLETAQIDQTRVTKRELESYKEDTNEEIHFLHQFKGANIKITPSTTKIVNRAIEQKCFSCKKRMMSVKSLNNHMDICPMNQIDAFFSQLKSLYSQRVAFKLTTNEFVLYSIKLVFDTQKKLQVIARANNIDVDAITNVQPAQELTDSQSIQIGSSKQRANQSPDYGYISGNTF